MSTRVPQRPSSALVGGAPSTRTVASILAEEPTTGYVRRQRHVASASVRRSTTQYSTHGASGLRVNHSVYSVSRSDARQRPLPRDEERQLVRDGLTGTRRWSRARHLQGGSTSASKSPDFSHTLPIVPRSPHVPMRRDTHTESHNPHHRQAPLSLHRSLFAGVLLRDNRNSLVKRIMQEPEDAFLAATRAMAARLGLRVLREMDLLLLLLSIFHGEPIDEAESHYLFKYLDFRGQDVVDLREALEGLSTLYRPCDVTAALCCKRLVSGQVPPETLITLDELTRMVEAVASLLIGHLRVDAAALALAQKRVVEQVELVQLDHCIPSATAHRLLKKETALTEALMHLDWNGKILPPSNRESELERLLKGGGNLRGAPATNRRRAALDAEQRSRENKKILGLIHDIYASTFVLDEDREASTERPIDATHPRFVADKYIKRSRATSSVA